MVKDSTDHEMLHIWGLIPHEKRDYKSLQNKAKQSNLDVEDPMLFKLLIAQSMIETKDYKVLTTIEEYDNLINIFCKLEKKIEEVQSKLNAANAIEKATQLYLKVTDTPKRRYFTGQETNKKLALEIIGIKEQQAKVQLQLLQHTAGILCLAIQMLHNTGSYQEKRFDVKYKTQDTLNKNNSNLNIHQLLERRIQEICPCSGKGTCIQCYEKEYSELTTLKREAANMELHLSLIQVQVGFLQSRESNIKEKIDECRNEVFFFRDQKEQLKCSLSTTFHQTQNLLGFCDELGELSEFRESFTRKEDSWIKESARLETKFEDYMKEVDRLGDLAKDFEEEQVMNERRINLLVKQKEELELQLMDKEEERKEEAPTTAVLRKEFREIIASLLADQKFVLAPTIERKKSLLSQLRDAKHERALSRYKRVNQSAQTLFRP